MPRSRRWAGTCVLAWREKPLTLAQRVPVKIGLSPSEPKPEPMRRKVDPRHDLLPGPFAKGNALLHRGPRGAGQLGVLVASRVVARGHHVLDVRFEITQRAQLADDTLADRVEHRRDLRISGRLLGSKTWREPPGCAVLIDPLKKNNMDV